jgi:hypothetical protein
LMPPFGFTVFLLDAFSPGRIPSPDFAPHRAGRRAARDCVSADSEPTGVAVAEPRSY